MNLNSSLHLNVNISMGPQVLVTFFCSVWNDASEYITGTILKVIYDDSTCIFTKNYLTMYLNRVNFMLPKIYFKNMLKKKSLN